MRITHPVLPLAEFDAALRRGHGRAIQHILSHGSNGLESIIVKACVTCLSYDPQLEAERTPWLFSIVDRANLNADVLQAIRTAGNTPSSENYWDYKQRSEILRELAASGSEEAKHVLYASLARSQNTGDVIGVEEIIALDGVDGLIHVARQMGQWMQADPEFWKDDSLIARFDAPTKNHTGLTALEREAVVDPDIARYLAGVRKTCDGRSGASTGSKLMSYSGDEVVAYVRKSPREQCYWLRIWGKRTTEDQREKVFTALVVSEDPEQVKRLFLCFEKTGLPRFESRLLRWIDHADAHVRWAAVAGLTFMTHSELRQAAKRLVAHGDMANGIALLVRNFHEGDFAMCAEHLSPLDDADEMHHLVGNLLDLCEAHAGHEALDCLLYIYEFSPCSTCRNRAVKALIETNGAPAWVLEECAFDADPDTRKLVRADDFFKHSASNKPS